MQTEPRHPEFVDDSVGYKHIPDRRHDPVPPNRDTPGDRRHRWAAFSILGVAALMLLGVYVVWRNYIIDAVAVSASVVAWLAVGAVAVGLLLGGIAASIIYATGD